MQKTVDILLDIFEYVFQFHFIISVLAIVLVSYCASVVISWILVSIYKAFSKKIVDYETEEKLTRRACLVLSILAVIGLIYEQVIKH